MANFCCCCSVAPIEDKKSHPLSTVMKKLNDLSLGAVILACTGLKFELSNFCCSDCKYLLTSFYKFRQKVHETYEKLLEEPKDAVLKSEPEEDYSALEIPGDHDEEEIVEKKVRKERLPQRAISLQLYKRGEDGFFSCPQCPSKFSFIGRLETHVDVEHSHEGEESFQCRLCKTVFPLYKELRQHMGEVHTPKPFSCDLCGKRSSTFVSIRSHITRMHLFIGRGSQAAKALCTICGKSSSSKEALARHIKHKHMPKDLIPKPYSCSVCGLKWKDKSSLNKHVQLHFNTTEWECNQCGKKLASKYGLLNHISWVHEGERKFCCDLCGKSFKGKAGLQEHQRTHSDDKPFKCPACPASFKSTNTLRTHKKLIHTDNPEVTCDVCHKIFKNYACLKSHSQLHTAPDLPCHICNKVYKVRDSLNRHVRAFHNGIKKRHRCKLCGHNLWSRKHVAEHVESQHAAYLLETAMRADDLVERYLTSEGQLGNGSEEG